MRLGAAESASVRVAVSYPCPKASAEDTAGLWGPGPPMPSACRRPGRDLRCRALPNYAVLETKTAPAAPLARRQRRALPWEARPAHAGPRLVDRRSDCTTGRAPMASAGRVPCSPVSGSRPPRQWRPAGRRMRPAYSPAIDPAAGHLGSAAIRTTARTRARPGERRQHCPAASGTSR